jgi:hypothetical protein
MAQTGFSLWGKLQVIACVIVFDTDGLGGIIVVAMEYGLGGY